MNVINVSQGSPEWAAWRSKGVTASEAAVVLGRSPYKTPWRLWAERTGAAIPEDLSANPFVQRGIALEDEVRQRFEARNGTILLPVCVESDEHPILRASLDGLSNEDEPVELKVPSDKVYREVAEQREQSLPYRLYWVQVQHQLYVTGAERGWLVFDPCRQGSPPLEFVIDRDERFLSSELVPACLRFWEAVETGRAPLQDPKRDLYVPEGDALAQWRQAASQYRALSAKRGQLEDRIRQLKVKLDDIEGDFVDLMGEFLLADSEGVRVTRYLQSGSVDYKALLKDIAPELDEVVVDQYRRKASQRVRITLEARDEPETVAPVPLRAASFYF